MAHRSLIQQICAAPGWKLLEARLGKDIAKLREDIAKRDTTNTRWLIGIITAATAIIIGVVLSNS